MKLVIAEKPSVAMALASVLGARTRKDGYVEGNGYIVSWCVGHLVASYEQIDNCPKKGHKKIPPNLKTNSEGNLGYNKITHPNIVFFIW